MRLAPTPGKDAATQSGGSTLDNHLSGITVGCGPHLPCAGVESLDALGREIFQRPELFEIEQSLELLERNTYYPFLKLKKQAAQSCILIGPDADRYAARLGPSFFLDDPQASSPTMPAAGPLEVVTLQFGASPVMSADARNDSLGSEVLAALSEIKNIVSTAHPPKNVKRPGGGVGKTQKMTVDKRLKALHENASELAETKTLRELGKLLGCSPSAFDRGDYFEKTLKEKRAAVRALKAMKRAGGRERYEAEDRDATRANRAHAESCEDIGNGIDATWDKRQGGRFSG